MAVASADKVIVAFAAVHAVRHPNHPSKVHLRSILENATVGAQVFYSTTVVTGGSVSGCFGDGYSRSEYRAHVFSLGVLAEGSVEIDPKGQLITFPMKWHLVAQSPFGSITKQEIRLVDGPLSVQCPWSAVVGAQIETILRATQVRKGIQYLRILALLRRRLAAEIAKQK